MTVTMLSATQAAEVLNCPLSSLYRHVERKGADPAYRFPRSYRLGPRMLRFRAEDIAEYLDVPVDRIPVA